MALGDMEDPTDYGTIVRNNLMKRPGYAPYCMGCSSMSRMVWDGEQFKHPCGARTEFPDDFIAIYKPRREELLREEALAYAPPLPVTALPGEVDWKARAQALAEATKVVAALLQAERTRSGGQPFSGRWSIPSVGFAGTIDDGLDAADAALAAWEADIAAAKEPRHE